MSTSSPAAPTDLGAIPAGVIAIGRNEGERLRRCLASVVGRGSAVVYVDSASTDGSVALARSMGAHVVELDMSLPFSAARARNEGFAALETIAPGLQYVQFIDGDCEVVDGWIDKARSALAADERLAAVCGRRRERFPDKTIYNRLTDLEWATAAGPAKSVGGDAMIRTAAFRDVGGYNPAVIAGEEPEMCVRLRARGWTIYRLDAEMTLHDAAMTRFGQWWKRMLRGGHAYAEGAARHGRPPERMWVRQSISIWLWAVVIPVTIAAVSVLVSRWASLVFAVYPMLAAKVALARRRRGDGWRDAAAYAFFCVLAKWPQLFGQCRYWSNRLRGRRATIVEYKPALPRAGLAGPS